AVRERGGRAGAQERQGGVDAGQEEREPAVGERGGGDAGALARGAGAGGRGAAGQRGGDEFRGEGAGTGERVRRTRCLPLGHWCGWSELSVVLFFLRDRIVPLSVAAGGGW